MQLSVLHIAYPYAPVGLRACGGAEQVLTDLDRALIVGGHRSTVVACEGSESRGRLYTAPVPQGRLDASDSDCRFWQRRYQEAINHALASQQFDLVHMHGIDWYQYSLPANLPVLVTLHMPIDWYPKGMWQQAGRNVHFQCVSETQKQGCPDRNAAVVGNGVEIGNFSGNAPRRRFALALGRICPEKNLHEALNAGTVANTPVLVGGQTFPYSSHQEYERTTFRPALRGSGRVREQHAFLGPLKPRRKQALLRQAQCLLHPTLAPETSSLVAMEALAAGTPVIAYRSGALPEIVEDGVTGFLVNNVAEMADAIARVDTLDRQACRHAAERRFSRDRMSRDYLDLYASILNQHVLTQSRYA